MGGDVGATPLAPYGNFSRDGKVHTRSVSTLGADSAGGICEAARETAASQRDSRGWGMGGGVYEGEGGRDVFVDVFVIDDVARV